MQRSVTLSSTEEEYVALSEVVTEIMVAKQVLEFLEIPVTLPIEVHVDNVGAIFLATNATTGQRTRHIDVRYHYVREYIEDGQVIIRLSRAETTRRIHIRKIRPKRFTKNIHKLTWMRMRWFATGRVSESPSKCCLPSLGLRLSDIRSTVQYMRKR